MRSIGPPNYRGAYYYLCELLAEESICPPHYRGAYYFLFAIYQ
jgi:hypothetical protein